MTEGSQHPEKILDVVCNSYVGPDEDQVEYKEVTYYFCCKGCKDLFQENPDKYLNKQKKSQVKRSYIIMEMCPVCAKESARESINGVVDGIIYYFCCQECKDNFMAAPRRYINCCEQANLKINKSRKGRDTNVR